MESEPNYRSDKLLLVKYFVSKSWYWLILVNRNYLIRQYITLAYSSFSSNPSRLSQSRLYFSFSSCSPNRDCWFWISFMAWNHPSRLFFLFLYLNKWFPYKSSFYFVFFVISLFEWNTIVVRHLGAAFLIFRIVAVFVYFRSTNQLRSIADSSNDYRASKLQIGYGILVIFILSHL